MHSKSNIIEIVIYDKTDAVEELFESFFLDTKLCWKHQLKVLVLPLIVLIYCIANILK